MFTGIVAGTGRVSAVDRGAAVRLRIEGEACRGPGIGDSVAVAGVCLTVVGQGDGWIEADVVAETLRLTTLGDLSVGDAVNIELPLPADGRFGGHMVQGHVDGVGRVRTLEGEAGDVGMWIDLDGELLGEVAVKGSIAVEGVSLTVAGVDEDGFGVALIPHTLEVTTLGSLAAGDSVNIETDVLAKYVSRLMEQRS